MFDDSLSSDNSDVEDMLLDNDIEHTMVIVAVKNLQDWLQIKMQHGSIVGHLCIPRHLALGHAGLMQDYFSEVPIYQPSLFRRRYQKNRQLFVKIVQACEANCRYFTSHRNIARTLGFSTFEKISEAMRVIAYGIPINYTNEYLRIGKDTTIQFVRMFAKPMIRIFGPMYIRSPNEEDTKKLMSMNEKRGWPGMLGNVYCMHWTWKNFPKA
jgi:hypothetical protein